MATSPPLVVRWRLRWWAHAYLLGVVFMMRITGAIPDPDRLDYWLRRGIRVWIWRGEQWTELLEGDA